MKTKNILFILTIHFICLFSLNAFSADKCESLFTERTFTVQTSEAGKQVSTDDQRTINVVQKVKENLNQFLNRFQPQSMTDAMAAALYNSVKKLANNPTAKRVENKVVSTTAAVKKALSHINEKLKQIDPAMGLIDRDKKIPGFKNVTYTEYTHPFSVKIEQLVRMGFVLREDLMTDLQKTVKVKIRLRSYGTVPENLTQFRIEDIQFADFTKERLFVEFKFEDVSYEEGAVFKPQMYFSKAYAKLFSTKEFLQRYDEIKQDTLNHIQISEKKSLDKDSVEAMLEFIRLAHVENLDLSVVAINLYGRVANSLVLKYDSTKDKNFDHSIGDIEKVELQMTFDDLIAFFVPGEKYGIGANKYYQSYTAEQMVAEFKTPTIIAHHLKRAFAESKKQNRVGLIISAEHAAELKEISPGLKEYFELIDEIVQARDASRELNRGKWGTAVTKVKQEFEKLLNAFYSNDYEAVP